MDEEHNCQLEGHEYDHGECRWCRIVLESDEAYL